MHTGKGAEPKAAFPVGVFPPARFAVFLKLTVCTCYFYTGEENGKKKKKQTLPSISYSMASVTLLSTRLTQRP